MTEPERDEWQAIYASYRSRSVMSGSVVGVDLHEFRHNAEDSAEKPETKTVRCLIVINYRVKVIIPEHEVFLDDFEYGYHLLHSMCGGAVTYVITYIDREAGFAIGSRKYALRKMRSVTARRNLSEGQMIDVRVLSVGRNMCTVTYGGYDMALPQRNVSYNVVSDLRELLHPGEIRKAVVKQYDPEEGILRVSLKEATPHPFDGIETRHPPNSVRIATVVGKYAGGVYCRLYDHVTDVICSYVSMEFDGDYKVGDTVEVIITRYNTEKKQIYGKILRKMR